MKRAGWLVAPFALALGACGGDGNTGRAEPNVALWAEVPWADHGTPQFTQNADGTRGEVLMATLPVYPPIGQNEPDPGSRKIDCSGLDDIEVSPYYVDTFEPLLPVDPSSQQPRWGVATAWSSYDDGSDGAFRVPGDVGWYSGLGGTLVDGSTTPYGKSPISPWGLAADRLTGERPSCDGSPNDWALHYRGGRFNYYGGGMSHAFSPKLDTGLIFPENEKNVPLFAGGPVPWMFQSICPPGSDLCPENPELFQPADGGTFFEPSRPHFWDLSAYDGVVFWARRGPDGATGLLVGLQNKYTSDDLARENETYCKRLKVCVPRCVNGFSCVKDLNPKEPVTRCMPASEMDPTTGEFDTSTKVVNPALLEFLFPRCEEDACKPAAFYPDVEFENTQCNAFEFTANDAGYWCSSDKKPVAAWAERCGDGFVAPISLSTDWQLYKLPWDAFRQVGFGKVAPNLDLKTLYSIAFQFTVGNADVYVDNVSFYRNK